MSDTAKIAFERWCMTVAGMDWATAGPYIGEQSNCAFAAWKAQSDRIEQLEQEAAANEQRALWAEHSVTVCKATIDALASAIDKAEANDTLPENVVY